MNEIKKKIVAYTIATKPITVREKYIFLVNNEDLSLAINHLGRGARSVAIEYDFTAEDFISVLRENELKPTLKEYIFIPCLDSKANKEIIEYLKNTFLTSENDGYTVFNNSNGYLKQPGYEKELDERITKYIVNHSGSDDEIVDAEAAAAALEAYKKGSTAYYLTQFQNDIKESANRPCIPTGFNNLDKSLDGGLYEGLYIFGAITSLGKTTYVQQIADNIAAAGHDILYISLEMSKNELISKSISRHTFMNVTQNGLSDKLVKTARGITAGARYKNYTEEEKEAIDLAIVEYARYSEHIYIVEATEEYGVKQIAEAARTHLKATGKAPVIVVDYMQILAPYERHLSDKQNADKNTMELKRLSRELKTPVIAISSVNRANYLTPIDLESFKESGGIEYGSDVVVGLQLKVLENEIFTKDGHIAEKREKVREAKADIPREIQALILKNRQGRTSDALCFNYYPLYNYFEEA